MIERGSDPRRRRATAPGPMAASRAHGDRGSVLILVLVLVVVAGLIVIPLMNYTMSVLRLNTAVSERTKDVEAAKGGLRVALSDPKNVFNECDNGGNLTNPGPVNGHVVSVSCTELQEIGPLEALGYEVPVGAVATQVGAEVPATFVGSMAQSDPILPYPTTADWWSSQLPVATGRPPGVTPDAVVETWDAKDGSIWMPELPRWPSIGRLSTPFDMPPAFGCKVFFPGHYDAPVDLTNGNIYFASGVYYFDEPVTVSGNANVVVGYGLADFGDDCADDLQAASNVVAGPGTFAIDGVGATWVFGGNGRLVVDDTASGSPRIRFNQRYAKEDRGGRVSIMTVNGDTDGPEAHDVGDVSGAHEVPFVSSVPLSQVLSRDPAEPDPAPANGLSIAAPIVSGTYEPSSSAYTDEARLPEAPASFALDGHWYDDAGTPRGALLLSWDPLVGNAGGGSPISDYSVSVSPAEGSGCASIDDLVVTASGQVSCLITGLALDSTTYSVDVAGVNAEGTGPAATASAMPMSSSSDVHVSDPVENVVVDAASADDVARVTWVPSSDDGHTPTLRYEVTAQRVYTQPGAPAAPLATDATVTTTGLAPVTFTVPAYDPNGDTLALSVDTSLSPGWTVAPGPSGHPLEITLTPDASVLLDASYTFDYTVTDPGGATDVKQITMNYVTVPGVNPAPVVAPMTIELEPGVTFTGRAPVYDPDGDDLTFVINLSDPPFVPGEWTFGNTGLDETVTTTAPDGTYDLPYTVTDTDGAVTSGTVTIVVSRTYETRGSCTVVTPPSIATTPTSPIPTWYELPTSCDIAGLADLAGPTDVGYLFEVVATNAVGDSAVASSAIRPPSAPFDGGGTSTPPLAPTTFDPWEPEPVIDIKADGAGATIVSVAGYVSVPMGRIHVENPAGDDITLVGGVLAGTFDVNDSRGSSGDPGTVPIGFRNDIVLQRKVRIVATAGNADATAVVQVNEDGASYAINSWLVN